jgi:hypothetical protein
MNDVSHLTLIYFRKLGEDSLQGCDAVQAGK